MDGANRRKKMAIQYREMTDEHREWVMKTMASFMKDEDERRKYIPEDEYDEFMERAERWKENCSYKLDEQ